MVAVGQGTGHGEEVGVLGLDVVRQRGCGGRAARGQQAGDRQGHRLALADGHLRGIGVGQPAVIGEDHVGVGAAEAEAGDTGDLLAGVLGPLARVLDHFEVLGVEVDIAVGAGVVDAGRDDTVAHTLDDLDEADYTGGGLGVADVGLGGAQKGRGGGLATRAEHAAQRGGLDGVTQDGAGAVGLDVVHVLRADAGVGVRALEDVDLCLRVRGGQAVGVAVGVDGGALDDGGDGVAVALGIGQALEHEHARGIRADDAVGVVGEGVDSARGRGNAQLAKSNGGVRGGQNIDAAGQGHVGRAHAQVLDRLVDRHEGGRAGGVHVDGRTAQVEGVGQAVGDDGRGRTGHGVGVHLCRVGGDEHAVVVVGGAHVDAGGGAAQLVGGHAGVLESLPGHLEEDALLRIHVGRLQRGEAKEFGVEASDVLEVAAVGVLLFHLLTGNRVGGVLRPTPDGQRAGAGAAFGEHVPELGDVVGAREAAGVADNGDVAAFDKRLSRCGLPGASLGSARGRAVDQAVRQLRDGGVLVGHGGLELNAQKVF